MRRLLALTFALLVCSVGVCAVELRVMTFNVRYPNPKDGAHVWSNRRDVLLAAIRARTPDLIGTQELYFEQGEYIVQQLPEYRWFGISRRGNHTDEHMGVFYKAARMEVLESGNFWLSETPDKPGSMSWNITLPRMVTWGRFRLRPAGPEFYFLNTHLPHRPEDAEARVNCAKVILEFISKLPREVPLILTGDFNDPAGGRVYQLLTEQLRDAWAISEGVSGPEGTFHGFSGQPGPARIDWILLRGNWRVLEVETMTFRRGKLYPSDHFPVVATIELR